MIHPIATVARAARLLRKVIACALLAGAVAPCFAIHDISISSYVSAPHASTAAIMRGGMFAFAGGVIPRGDVVFMDDGGRRVSAADLELVTDATGRAAIRWEGRSYDLLIQKSLVCPLARYVRSGTVIAFTIAVVADNEAFLKRQGLVTLQPGIYVARELESQAGLLVNIDLADDVKDIEEAPVRQRILDSMNKVVADSASELASVGALSIPGDGTYVNADFNVRYQARLVTRGSRRFVDIGGMPLRYHWQLGADGKTPRFTDVQTFRFPQASERQQVLNVTFFQNAAVFRHLHRHSAAAFGKFVADACANS